MRTIKTMPVAEFQAAINAQGVEPLDYAVVCPQCGTVQSARDFIKAGAGDSLEAVQKHVGFDCVGRFTGAGSPRMEHDGRPCNWTLGGFFIAHTLEIVTDDGKHHPHFEPATHDQAIEHAKGGAA